MLAERILHSNVIHLFSNLVNYLINVIIYKYGHWKIDSIY